MPIDNETVRWPLRLLWPDGEAQRRSVQVSTATAADLALERIVRALDVDGQHARVVWPVLLELCSDPETIAYRQAIVGDLLDQSRLVDALSDILPVLHG